MSRAMLSFHAGLDLVLCGVGGQGIILAADVLALVGLELDLDVKKSEVHGMAQRGGSVVSHLRWGERVYSPLVAPGTAQILIAFERLEALRHAEMVRAGGVCLINDYRIAPVAVSSGDAVYPSEEDERRVYASLDVEPAYVPAIALARQVGEGRTNNVVMLGALSSLLDVPEEVWYAVLARRVPERYAAVNRQAFRLGRERLLAWEPVP